MSGAYIEMLPPDRPIHMLGQPIIHLVASGGPGGDLGEWPRGRHGRRSGMPMAPRMPMAAPSYYYPPPLPPPPVFEAVVPMQADAIVPMIPGASGSIPSASDVAQASAGGMGQINWDLQRELTQVAEGGAPDVSAEYFRPSDVPGLPSDSSYEGPHTGREGIYPKKLRDMVEYDMSGTAYPSVADITGAMPMPVYGNLGCCGADGMGQTWGRYPSEMGQVRVTDRVRQNGVDVGAALGQFGTGMGQFVAATDAVRQHGVDAGAALGQTWGRYPSEMGQVWGRYPSELAQLPVDKQAKKLKDHCDGLEQKAKDLIAAVKKAAESDITDDQKKKIVADSKKALHHMKKQWHQCRHWLKSIIAHFEKTGKLKAAGLSGVADDVKVQDKLNKCREKLHAIRQAACGGHHHKKGAPKTAPSMGDFAAPGMGEPWNGRPERGTWNH